MHSTNIHLLFGRRAHEYYKIIYKNIQESINNDGLFLYGGEGYKTPKEVISNNESINSYSMNSVSWKAIQELDQKIEKLLNILKKVPILGKIVTKRWKK